MEKKRNACTTLLVLRQEDGAARPEKKIVLEPHCRVETKRERIAKRTNCPPRREGYIGDLRERRRSCPPRRKYSPDMPAIFGISEEMPYSRLLSADI